MPRGGCRRFSLEIARSGEAVALVGRNRGALDKLSGEIRALGGARCSFVADVRDPGSASSTVTPTSAWLGPVTILTNNAALLSLGSVATLDPGQFWETTAVNVHRWCGSKPFWSRCSPVNRDGSST